MQKLRTQIEDKIAEVIAKKARADEKGMVFFQKGISEGLDITYDRPTGELKPIGLYYRARPENAFPENSYLEIDFETGRTRVGVAAAVHLEGDDADTYHGRGAQHIMDGKVWCAEVRAVLSAPECQILLDIISGGYDTEIRNGNKIGSLTENSHIALDLLIDIVDRHCEPKIDGQDLFDCKADLSFLYDDPTELADIVKNEGLKPAAYDVLGRLEDWLMSEGKLIDDCGFPTANDLVDDSAIPTWISDHLSDAEWDQVVMNGIN